jgi:hypothetical protein
VSEPPRATAVSRRDLGSRGLTNDRIILTLIEVQKARAGVSAYRSSADWLIVLKGSALVSNGDGVPPTSLAPLDALAFGRHLDAPRLIELGGERFAALELELPAGRSPTVGQDPGDQG